MWCFKDFCAAIERTDSFGRAPVGGCERNKRRFSHEGVSGGGKEGGREGILNSISLWARS